MLTLSLLLSVLQWIKPFRHPKAGTLRVNLFRTLSSAEARHFGPSIRAASMAQSAMEIVPVARVFSLLLSAAVKQLNAPEEESVFRMKHLR